MKKRKTVLAALLTAAVAVMSGCGNQAGGQAAQTTETEAPAQETETPGTDEAQAEDKTADEVTDLWFYYPTQVGGDLATGMEEIVADFNTAHPNINVTAVYTGSYKQTAQKAMSDLAAGNGPSVILSGMLDIVDYYNVGELEDLTTYIDAEGTDWSSDFVDGFWGNFVMADGKTYGLPFQHSVCVLYYNKDLLDAAGVKVPENWTEMQEAVKALQAYDSNIIPVEFPSDVWVLEALTLSDSGSLIRSKTETNFDSKEVVDSLDFMGSLIKEGGMIRSYAEAGEDFVAESCAMMLNTTGNLGFAASGADFNWDVTMVPVNTTPGFSYGGGGLVMTADQSDAEKAASWEFMKYMTSPEVSAKWMTVSGYFTVRKSAEELPVVQDYYTEHPQLQHAADLLQYTSAQWSTDHYWDVYGCMQTALDSVLIDGSVSAEDALSKAQTDAIAVLGE